tara:strand:+ start:49 stop:678 length:630 start_codon:yes stop_codon:yes gene_type:complete
VTYQQEIKDPFIWVNDNVVPTNLCDEIVQRFEKYKNYHQQGCIGKGIDTQIKDSKDLQISDWLEFRDISLILDKTLNDELYNYREHCEKTTRKSFVTGEELPLIIPMPKIYQLSHQVQKTSPTKGYTWHSDALVGRILSYIFYLNDVEEGWTEFWQGDKVAPKKGRLLIFPADRTYYHQGYPPKQDKYISIGWLTAYQNPEELSIVNPA